RRVLFRSDADNPLYTAFVENHETRAEQISALCTTALSEDYENKGWAFEALEKIMEEVGVTDDLTRDISDGKEAALKVLISPEGTESLQKIVQAFDEKHPAPPPRAQTAPPPASVPPAEEAAPKG
ncbi:MAG: hypothetical protein AB7G06_03975, partial [Bdellovibrionales bacterium]